MCDIRILPWILFYIIIARLCVLTGKARVLVRAVPAAWSGLAYHVWAERTQLGWPTGGVLSRQSRRPTRKLRHVVAVRRRR